MGLPAYPGGNYLTLNFPHPPDIIGSGIMPVCSKMVLFGPPKKGKSILINQLVLDICNGKRWLGFQTTMVSILYINMEIPHWQWQKRFDKRCKAHNMVLTDQVILVAQKWLKLDQPDGQSELENIISYMQPQVVILDPWYRLLSESVTDDKSVLAATDFMDRMIDTYKVAFLICHHTRKAKITQHGILDAGFEEMAGSSNLYRWVDSVVYLNPITQNGEKSQLFFAVRLGDDAIVPLNLEMDRKGLGFIVKP
jgi:RecA-family ATPase